MNLEQLSTGLHQLRKKKEYESFLQRYKSDIHQHFDYKDIRLNKWLVTDILHCLRKTKKAKAAVSFFKQNLNMSLSDDVPLMVLSEFAWNIYALLKYEKSIDSYEIIKEAKIIITKLSVKDNYLLYTKLLFAAAERALQSNPPHASNIVDMLSMVDTAQLSDKPNEMQTKPASDNQKKYQTASDREKYYMLITKALFAEQQYETCIVYCQKALSEIKKMHFGNHVWFRRREAQSLYQLKKTDHAIEIYAKILRMKSDWFIKKELAELYFSIGKYDSAYGLAIDAALDVRNIEYGVDLYLLIADLLYHRKQYDKAIQHYRLVYRIRNDNQWRISDDLITKIKELTEYDKDKKLNNRELKKFWQNEREIRNMKQRIKGRITKILHTAPNGDGFITATNGKAYYFKMQWFGNPKPHAIEEQMNVEFVAKQSRYKGKEVWQAKKIVLIGL